VGKITEADTLHDSRDEIAPSLFGLAHKAVDCSREGRPRSDGAVPTPGLAQFSCIRPLPGLKSGASTG
jgi:hypothetical protein